MSDHVAFNVRNQSLAAWRRRYDHALRWRSLHGRLRLNWCMNPDGFVILRRWQGSKYPRPTLPLAVGFADRGATVSSDAGATYSNDTVYWHEAELVSRSGIPGEADGRTALPSVWGPAGYLGPIPNMPTDIMYSQTSDAKFALSWLYNPLRQQVAPERFDVFSDGGTGTMDLSTVVASVTYAAGRLRYSWQSGTFANGVARAYTVRARSAAGVYSLIPVIGSPTVGPAPAYGTIAAHQTARMTMRLTLPATPATPLIE